MSTSKDRRSRFAVGSVSGGMKPKGNPAGKPTQLSGPSAPTTMPGSSAAPSLATTDPAPIAMPDTPVPSNDKSRRLRCVIEREPVVFTVSVPRDSEVDD